MLIIHLFDFQLAFFPGFPPTSPWLFWFGNEKNRKAKKTKRRNKFPSMKSITLRSYFRIMWRDMRNDVFQFHKDEASLLYVNHIQFSFLMKDKGI